MSKNRGLGTWFFQWRLHEMRVEEKDDVMVAAGILVTGFYCAVQVLVFVAIFTGIVTMTVGIAIVAATASVSALLAAILARTPDAESSAYAVGSVSSICAMIAAGVSFVFTYDAMAVGLFAAVVTCIAAARYLAEAFQRPFSVCLCNLLIALLLPPIHFAFRCTDWWLIQRLVDPWLIVLRTHKRYCRDLFGPNAELPLAQALLSEIDDRAE